MRWSIVEVARFSGVTARTLRHYDAIGLLPPAGVGDNRYRTYGELELLRLQEILVLRALGLSLADIRSVLDDGRDRGEVLREHHTRLIADRDRLGSMADTVLRTITELDAQKGTVMHINRPENLFEGFDPSQYDAEAKERWPEEHAQSANFVNALSTAETYHLQREMTAAMIRMAEILASGAAPDSPAAQVEADWLFRSVNRMWTPSAAAFTNLGRMYVDDPRFRANYDRVAPGLAEYTRDAMAEYATTRLE